MRNSEKLDTNTEDHMSSVRSLTVWVVLILDSSYLGQTFTNHAGWPLTRAVNPEKVHLAIGRRLGC